MDLLNPHAAPFTLLHRHVCTDGADHEFIWYDKKIELIHSNHLKHRLVKGPGSGCRTRTIYQAQWPGPRLKVRVLTFIGQESILHPTWALLCLSRYIGPHITLMRYACILILGPVLPQLDPYSTWASKLYQDRTRAHVCALLKVWMVNTGVSSSEKQRVTYQLNPTPFHLLIRSEMSTRAQPKSSQNDSQSKPLVKKLFELRWADRVTN